ncbi:MAG: methyltransferase domain-containing protein [Bacteroidetes bacterium]|nr:methyltransferase domain-containing protein [Bacteroidota bacterium]
MKIRHYLAIFSISITLLLAACGPDDPIAEGNTKAPKPADSTAQHNALTSDSASLQNLLRQYDPPGRDVWQKPEVVIGKMGDLSNKTVADIGAGSGFFSRRLAQQAKHVIAVELDPRFIHFMDSIKRVELKPEYQSRFETRLGLPNDPKLKPNEADIVLVVNTYIYIQNRIAYLKNLLNVMPQGGKIIIVDFKRKRMPIKYPRPEVRLELYEVENELDAAGFTNIESDDCALDYQYIVMAEK